MDGKLSALPWRRIASHGLATLLAAVLALGVRQILGSKSATSEHPDGASPARRSAAATRDSRPPLDLAGLGDQAIARLMESQPTQMMAAIDRMADRSEALRLATLCTRAVAGPDFDLLVAWARRQKDPKLTAAIFAELLPRWSREDLAGCLAFAHDLLGGDEDSMKAKDSLLRALPGGLGVEMLSRLPAEQQAQLLKQRPGRWATTNPEGAFDLIVKLPATATRREALTGLVEKWAGDSDVYHVNDPVAALNRVQQISDASLRGEGLRAAAAAWCRTNPPRAARWTEDLPAGPDKDAAIQGLVQFFAAKDSNRALAWAQEIGDSTLREEALKKLPAQ
ncbi:MAG: hypothetical protein JWO82_1168 [Akkermansiaceae bacterium]|nr:hypothetical protein [Akkermansiaceae bacterium]